MNAIPLSRLSTYTDGPRIKTRHAHGKTQDRWSIDEEGSLVPTLLDVYPHIHTTATPNWPISHDNFQPLMHCKLFITWRMFSILNRRNSEFTDPNRWAHDQTEHHLIIQTSTYTHTTHPHTHTPTSNTRTHAHKSDQNSGSSNTQLSNVRYQTISDTLANRQQSTEGNILIPKLRRSIHTVIDIESYHTVVIIWWSLSAYYTTLSLQAFLRGSLTSTHSVLVVPALIMPCIVWKRM